jgi:uncharacterized protein
LNSDGKKDYGFLGRKVVKPVVDRWRSTIRVAASSDNPPWFDSWGVAIGLAIGFGLPLGTQMLALGILRLIFRFNSALAFAFTWVNNPFSLIPMYYGYYTFGAAILNHHTVITAEAFRELLNPIITSDHFWELIPAFLSLGREIIMRWALGALVFGVLAGGLGYIICYRIRMRQFRRKVQAVGEMYEQVLDGLGKNVPKGGQRENSLSGSE